MDHSSGAENNNSFYEVVKPFIRGSLAATRIAAWYLTVSTTSSNNGSGDKVASLTDTDLHLHYVNYSTYSLRLELDARTGSKTHEAEETG